MHHHGKQVIPAHQAIHDSARPVLLLAEVDFKWLMAGQGWWIDPARFRQDPSYASHFLELAMDSPSRVLRDCAASLLHLIDSQTL